MFLGLMTEVRSVPDQLLRDFNNAMKLFKKGQFAASYQSLTTVQKKHRSLNHDAYHLEFDWLLQLNKYACKELCIVPVPQQVDMVRDCTFNESLIQQIHGLPPNTDHMEIELMVVYNWSVTAIKNRNRDVSHLEKPLTCIRECLFRLTSFADKNVSYSTDSLTVIVKSVLQCREELGLSVLHLFYLICFAACWLLMMQKSSGEALRLIRLLKESASNDSRFSQSVECIIRPLCPNSLLSDFMTDFMNLTMPCCLISSLQSIEESISCLSSIKSDEWKTSVNYVIASLHLNCGEAVKSLALAKSVLSSDPKPLPAKWRSRFLNLIGCGLASQGKFYSAVECFRKAITNDPTHLLPLLNICYQYKVLRNPDAELRGLNLLLQEVQKQDENEVIQESSSLEEPLPLISPLRITKADVLYLLAERYLELCRIDKSVEAYGQLLNHLTDSSLLQVHVCLPPLLQVYQEAAYAMYRSSDFEECIRLCERLTKKCPETVREIQPGMLRKSLVAEPSLSSDRMTNKRNNNPMFDPPSFSNLQLPSVNYCAVGCKTLMLKSLALTKLGNIQQALDILKRVRMSLSVIHWSNDDIEAPKKKSKVEVSAECSVDVETVNEWTILSSVVHCCLGVLHLQLEERKEAAVILRFAILTWPDNIEAYWHYTQLLLRDGDKEKATKTWDNVRCRLIEPFLSEKLHQVFYTISKKDVQELDRNVIVSDY